MHCVVPYQRMSKPKLLCHVAVLQCRSRTAVPATTLVRFCLRLTHPSHTHSDPESPTRPKVLIPGAGLARLCCEASGAGFEAQGNEFAYFMLITSSFVLNNISEREQ